MSNLPSGTVTFLFTDVQDSTRLWEKYPADMRQALKRHDEIIESLAQQQNGFVVRPRGEGDSRFVVFEHAIDGVSAAAAIQRALHAEPWPEQTPLYVRMSLHTGEGEFRDGDYYGTAVNRCARLRGIAHGGQTVISKTTYDLALEAVSQVDEFIDLGEHPLKGMQEPEHVFQLTGVGLPSEFPPLKSPDDVEEPPAPGVPPFKGLQHFDEADAGLFFGREMLTEKIVSRLRESISPEGDQDSFLALIVGASGSGKSSLVRAGLIPTLRESQGWPVHVITPGDHPLRALGGSLTHDEEPDSTTLIEKMARDPRELHNAASLALSKDDHQDHLLVVVDQFEETFTLCRDETERRAFIDNLLTAASSELAGPTVVVIVLRADFYGHCAQYANLREALANRQEFIGPMTQEELQRAIEEPARGGDWEFEPGLVDMLLQEVGEEPGALPLLSHALLETWKRRRGRMMTFTGYAESGGIRGAIAKTAERVYWRMSPEEQAITRNLFLRLTELGEGTDEGGMPSPDTRRRVMLTELLPGAKEVPEARIAIEEVLQILVEARLITTAEETAEVAHEALIREWPTLREWLNEDREGLLLHRHLTETAQEWERLERVPSELYRGKRLTQVLEWSWDHRDELNALEKEFLDASLADRRARQAAEEERQAKEAALERRSRNFLRALVGVFAVATVVAVFLSIFAFNQQGKAEENALLAGQNAATATVAQGQALYEAATAVAAQNEAQVEKQNALEQRNIADQKAQEAVEAYSLSLSVHARQALNSKDPVTALTLGLASAEMSDPPPGQVVQTLIDLANAPGPRHRYTIGEIHEGLAQIALSVALSPDGETALMGLEFGSLILFDLETGAIIHNLEGHFTWIHDLDFSPDGKTALSVDDVSKVILWDLSTGKEIRQFVGHTGSVVTVDFSPDGSMAVSGGFVSDDYRGGARTDPGELILWDVDSGSELRRCTEAHRDAIMDVAFTPDGQYILASSGAWTEGFLPRFDFSTDLNVLWISRNIPNEYDLILWDVDSCEIVQQYATQDHDNFSLAIHPSGDWFLAGSTDHNIYIWDLILGEQIGVLEGHQNPVISVVVSKDGTTALSAEAYSHQPD